MRLNPTFTVSNHCIRTPEKIISHLRSYFVELGVVTFATDETLEFSVVTELEGHRIQMVVQADKEQNRLLMMTLFYGRTKRSETALNELAAALNRGMEFASAMVIHEDGCSFVLESWLLLDDGAALTGQVLRLADTHREAVGKIGPWIILMLAGRINTTKVLAALAAETDPSPDERPKAESHQIE